MLDGFKAFQHPKLVTLSDFFQSPNFHFLFIEFAYLVAFKPIFPLLPSNFFSKSSIRALNPAAINIWQAAVCCQLEHGLVPWCAQGICAAQHCLFQVRAQRASRGSSEKSSLGKQSNVVLFSR